MMIPASNPALVEQAELPADRHPAAVYLAKLRPSGRRTMRQALDLAAGLLTSGRCDAETLPWAELRYQHVAALRQRLAERRCANWRPMAPATVNRALCAVRGVLREAWRLGLMPAEALQRAVDVPQVKASTLPRGRALSGEELRRLVAACPSGPVGVRDRALLAVLVAGGLRRAEAVALDLADWNAADGTLTVRGKGGRERLVPLKGGALAAVRTWLELRGTEPGALLCPVAKGGRLELRRLSAAAVFDRLRHLAERAQVGELSPHDLRRTLVSGLLDAGADLFAVAALVGHASTDTTRRYDRRGERAVHDAAALAPFPGAL
jgi:site-specific recombinase XerD